MSLECKHCGGPIAVRNPTGKCDHLFWPENLSAVALADNGFGVVDMDRPIVANENGHDYEVRVFFGQLGVRVATLDDTGTPCEIPHLSSDQARDLAARLVYAANQQDVF